MCIRDRKSRIRELWDQTDQSGTTPEGIGYGTVYTQEELNRALENAEPFSIVPSRDDSGHGTKLAAIAAGSENLETGWICLLYTSTFGNIRVFGSRRVCLHTCLKFGHHIGILDVGRDHFHNPYDGCLLYTSRCV